MMDNSVSPLRSPEQLPRRIAWQGDGWSVALDTDGSSIVRASLQWNDPAADKGLIGLVENCIVGLSPREARDHGVQYACHKHQLDGARAAATGIVMPASYSPTSRAAARALRAAIDAAMPPDPNHWNFEDHGLSESWRRIPNDERRRRIEALMDEFLRSQGRPGASFVTDIDEYDRVFIQFREDVPVAEKPSLLMTMERHVRRATGERIELFVSEMKDSNRIRRL